MLCVVSVWLSVVCMYGAVCIRGAIDYGCSASRCCMLCATLRVACHLPRVSSATHLQGWTMEAEHAAAVEDCTLASQCVGSLEAVAAYSPVASMNKSTPFTHSLRTQLRTCAHCTRLLRATAYSRRLGAQLRDAVAEEPARPCLADGCVPQRSHTGMGRTVCCALPQRLRVAATAAHCRAAPMAHAGGHARAVGARAHRKSQEEDVRARERPRP